MPQRIAGYDWDATQLGGIESWPQSLHAYVSLMLNAALPMFIAWGDERTWLYNDAFIPILGDKHPDALARPSREVWAEAWSELEPMFNQVFAGKAVRMDDFSIDLNRSGKLEESHFAFSYNPAMTLDGQVAGLFGACIETTGQIESIRSAAQSDERLQLALAAGGGVGTWDWDVQADRVVADERFAGLYGVDAERARRGAPIADFLAGIHPDDVPLLQANIDEALETCGELKAEYRVSQTGATDRWLSVQGRCFAGSDGKPVRLAGTGVDITERKTAERKREALVELTDRIRDIDDADELAYAAAEILGKTLGVSRAGYGIVDVEKETITIERDWNAPGIESLAGTLHFRDYGSYIEDLARGETVVFEDAERDPRTADTADALKAISAQSVVNMPVTEQGGFVALLYLNHETARPWPSEDLALIREFAARTRTATERLRVSAALRESESRFRNVADHAPLMMWVTDTEGYCTYLNRAWYMFTGQTEAEGEGFGWLDAVHPDDRGWSDETFQAANAKGESFRLEYRLRHHDGSYRWAIDAAAPRFGAKGQFLGYIGSVFDIDDRKRSEALRQVQNRLLELAIQDRPIADILEELILTVEQHVPSEMLGSILLVDEDGKHLRNGAAPSLPDAYTEAIDGIETGPGAGSCGSAAFHNTPVYVSDIATDPLWKDFRDLALGHGLRACWSTPIVSAHNTVLGTFAIYYRTCREPSPSDLEVVEFVTHTAALVIERNKAREALSAETRLLETLNNTGATLAGELDLGRVVQHVTDAGVEVTGAQFGAFFYNVEDEAGKSYMLYTLSGVERSEFENFPMPRKTEIFGPTFEGTGIVRSDDITTDPRYGRNEPYKGMPAGHLPVRSYLAVPVRSRDGSVLGGLFFGHSEAGKFTGRHQELMEGISGQAAIAVDNARLFQSAQVEIAERSAAEKALKDFNEQLEERVSEAIRERREAEAALHQVQRMESIGQLTGGVAHDFNNLLQVISGNLHLLAREVTGNPRAEQRVQNALLGVSRGAKLASQLLAFGRRQPLEPKVVNIGRLVRDLDDMLRRSLGEEIEIETTVAGGLWNTLVDPGQLENALLNLAINARDAMDGRGELTIEVGNAFLDDNYARMHADVDAGQYVLVAVTDTGSGMSPEIVDKVFEPFFTTKTDGRGTGLGLSMVYGFVKQSGGHAKIYSEVGHGTTIKLYLPRSKRAEDVKVATDAGPVHGGNETVLVVEDDDEVRATTVDVLQDLGYRVLKAPNADSALAVIESGVPIELLFTDVVMPGELQSPELARKARERLPNIAVLFTSGYTENAIVHGGRLDEGVHLLSKPYSREALARKVRQVLERRDHVPAPVPANARGEPAAVEERRKTSGLNILLVEDDALIRMDTADMLQELGHSVSEADSGEEARQMLKRSSFDVLITDVKLPGISGVELVDFAREIQPDLNIVFATGNSTLPDHERHIEAGAHLLVKPYDMNQIDQTLQSLPPSIRADEPESQ